MKKWFLAVMAILAFFLIPAVADAAEHSSDTMILDWSTSKVWVDKGNLCVRGTFSDNFIWREATLKGSSE